MIGERYGWVPKPDEIPVIYQRKYRWINSLSLTQMEIVYGVLRSQNQNALILCRNSDFLHQVPLEFQHNFLPKNPEKHKNIKETCINRLQDLLGPDKVMEYSCKFVSVNKKTEEVLLDGFNEFRNIITTFLQEKISAMYPAESSQSFQMNPVDLYKFYDLKHVAFFRQTAAKILAIKQDFNLLDAYLHDGTSNGPFILMGSEGSGKTLTMSSIAEHVSAQIKNGSLSNFSLFTHFVDADVCGKSLEFLLKRLLVALQSHVGTEPSDSGDLQRQSRLHLR